LVRDLQRYLADEPVEARPPSAAYRFKKYVIRNKSLVAAAGTVAAALVLGLIGTLWQARAARDQAARADERAKAADESAKAEADRASELKLVSDFQAGMLAQINPTKAGKELTANVTAKFAAALAKAKIPEADRPALIESFRAHWSRVNATDAARELINRTILKPAIKSIDEKFKDQPLVDAQLRQALANRYRDLGLFDEAMPLQESALATRRRVLGEEHPDTLVSLGNMGRQLESQGKLAEAELCFREALEKFRRVLGEEHPDTLVLVNNMGTLLWSEGKLAEAEPYYFEALEKNRRVRGEDHPETLVAINSMGVLLWTQGKLAEAEPYLREALQKRRRLLGEEHPNTLNSINNMGFLLKAQGKLLEAEPYLREALEKFRRVLGEEHPTTLIAIDNTGSLLRDQGKLAEAEPYLREALEKFRRVLGKEHPETLVSASNLGTLFQAQGKPVEAEILFREVLEARNRSLAPSDWLIASARLNLGGSLLGQKKFAEAESLLIDGYGGFAAAKNTPRKPRDFLRETCENIVKLYESWDSSEPGKGYDTKAAEWKTKLKALQPATPELKPAVNKKS
jgi:non-specific serine/threonine protein kinase/serine/threonine-protein kinase